ncbi:MAG: FAD-dependent oxidoreductase [Woeseiaceae bacterium]|nr:FAD-dependent oxidoreductase [Woeseiaceae bacterium]
MVASIKASAAPASTAGRTRRKIAVIGSGIAGNTAAYRLREHHDVTVFEAADRVGGHTNTIDVESSAGALPVDTGFIVFNDRTYPEFNRLLDEIGQDWQPSVMSFSVQSERNGLEYNGASLNAVFAQRRNAVRPSFLRMVRDILRFNRAAPGLLERGESGATLGEYLASERYGREFTDYYLVPMAAAIWSAEPARVRDMPAYFLVRFFLHHGLLQLSDRPQWRTVRGGSREYVRKLVAGHADRIRLNTPVRAIARRPDGVYIKTKNAPPERFDDVFIACHSDQALALLDDATPVEREVLGAIPYQINDAVLHTDTRLMPRRRRAWAAWNYHVPRDTQRFVSVTYNMNILQSLPVQEQYLVTLNHGAGIDPARVIERIEYEHPVFTRESVAAQARHAEVNSGGRTYYCGAYWRNGFHEDGVASALAAVRHFEEAQQRGELHFRRAG